MTEYYQPHIPLVLTNDGEEGTFWIPWRNTVELLDGQREKFEREKSELLQKGGQLVTKFRYTKRQLSDVQDSLQLAQQENRQLRHEMDEIRESLVRLIQCHMESGALMGQLEDKILLSTPEGVIESASLQLPIITKVESSVLKPE